MEMSRRAREKVVTALRTALGIQQSKLQWPQAISAIVALLSAAIDDEEPDPYWWESNQRRAKELHQKRAGFLKKSASVRRIAEASYREGWTDGRTTGTWRESWMVSDSRRGGLR
jgi:hypothetical protein